MLKPIKITSGMVSWDVKIDDKEITDNIFGIDIKLRAGKIPKIIYHRYTSKVEYEGEKCEIDIIDHKPLKVNDIISEDTNYCNCKNGKHYIKK